MNQGKVFERSFAESIPDSVYLQRLIDPAASFGGADSTRFSPHQPYDFYAYIKPHFFAIELKSTLSSLTFWRADFDADGNKHTYDIKKCQVKGLDKAALYNGVIAGFIINFRNVNKTYFLSIDNFHLLTDGLPKKSINHTDVEKHGKLIEQRLLKVKYRYNLKSFFEDMISD